jgi:tetratricopeptide (TPR) repeat protein
MASRIGYPVGAALAFGLGLCFSAAQAQDPSTQDLSIAAALRQSKTAYLRGQYREASVLLEAAAGPKALAGGPMALQADADTAQLLLSDLADLYGLQGRYAQAEAALRRVIAAGLDAGGERHGNLAIRARNLSRLGALLRAQGRYPEAEAAFTRAMELLEPAYGVDHAYVATCLASLAELARLQRRFDEAERLYWRAYMIRSYLYGHESSPVGETLSGLAAVYAAQRRHVQARELVERALAIAEKPPRAAKGWDRLDERDLRQMNLPEREAVATRGKITVREAGPHHLEFARHYDSLGSLYRANGRHAEAELMHRRSIAIRERAFGAEHPEIAQSRSDIAAAQMDGGDARQALQEARIAAAVLARRIGAWPAERAEYAEGERRRWRPSFLLLVSLLARESGPAGEAFAAIQHAQPSAGSEPPASEAEARGLLAPGEALLAAVSEGNDAYAVLITRDRAELRRIDGGLRNLAAVLRTELADVRRAFVVADAAPGPAPQLVRLPSVGALRALKQGAAGS